MARASNVRPSSIKSLSEKPSSEHYFLFLNTSLFLKPAQCNFCRILRDANFFFRFWRKLFENVEVLNMGPYMGTEEAII